MTRPIEQIEAELESARAALEVAIDAYGATSPAVDVPAAERVTAWVVSVTALRAELASAKEKQR